MDFGGRRAISLSLFFFLLAELTRGRKGDEGEKRKRKKKFGFWLKDTRSADALISVRVSHPHSALRRNRNDSENTEKFLSADALIRSAGHPIRTQYLVNFSSKIRLSRKMSERTASALNLVLVSPPALST